jgi:hypothetical protein
MFDSVAGKALERIKERSRFAQEGISGRGWIDPPASGAIHAIWRADQSSPDPH